MRSSIETGALTAGPKQQKNAVEAALQSTSSVAEAKLQSSNWMLYTLSSKALGQYWCMTNQLCTECTEVDLPWTNIGPNIMTSNFGKQELRVTKTVFTSARAPKSSSCTDKSWTISLRAFLSCSLRVAIVASASRSLSFFSVSWEALDSTRCVNSTFLRQNVFRAAAVVRAVTKQC